MEERVLGISGVLLDGSAVVVIEICICSCRLLSLMGWSNLVESRVSFNARRGDVGIERTFTLSISHILQQHITRESSRLDEYLAS